MTSLTLRSNLLRSNRSAFDVSNGGPQNPKIFPVRSSTNTLSKSEEEKKKVFFDQSRTLTESRISQRTNWVSFSAQNP